MIAALFVARGGVYFGVEGVDPYDEARDATTYAGPHAVVAHPPCQRFGRYWSGGPSAKVRRLKGDDGGCFASALASVRAYGGVLEHPEASHAWRLFGLFAPPRGGGWITAGDGVGWTCCVEQGHYGHAARKATWLYSVGCVLPSLKWGRSSSGRRLDLGFHSAEERRAFFRPPAGASPEFRAARREFFRLKEEVEGKALCVPERLSQKERLGTPLPFRDLLLGMARSVKEVRHDQGL